jgi:hypothetical protein
LNNSPNILSHNACLSELQIINYLQQKCNANDCAIIEHHFTNCALCSDAIDGYSILSNDEINKIIADLPKEFTPKKTVEKPTFYIGWKRVAAIASSLLVASVAGAWFYNNVYHGHNTVAQNIAKNTISETKDLENIAITDSSSNTITNEPQKTIIQNTAPIAEIKTGKLNEVSVVQNDVASAVASAPQAPPTIQKIEVPTPAREEIVVANDEQLRNKNEEAKAAEVDNTRYVTTEKATQAAVAQTKNLTEEVVAKKTAQVKKYKEIYPSALANNYSNNNYNNDNNVSNGYVVPQQATAATSKDKYLSANTFDIALSNFNSKNYSTALPLFQKCIQENINAQEAEYKLALCYKYLNQESKATEIFLKISASKSKFKKAAAREIKDAGE